MATAPFDSLKPMSFDGIPFPYKTYRVHGGIRKHPFEFPHQGGGVVEKLGRKLYEVHVTVSFTEGLSNSIAYPHLLDTLTLLRQGYFEIQKTADLHIPHIGTIKACAESWQESAVNTNRSTIEADVTFFEDQESAFLLASSFITFFDKSIQDKLDVFNGAALKAQIEGSLKPASKNLFSQINDAAVAVLGIVDQVNLYGSLIVSKVEGFAALLQEADEQVKEINHPDLWPLVDALHDLWLSAVQLNQDLHDKGSILRTFTVPVQMGIAQVAGAIFGDSAQAATLMTLNALEDPLAIPAGTTIVYYEALLGAAA